MNRLTVSSLGDNTIATNQPGVLQRGGSDSFQSITPQTQKIAGLDARANSFELIGDNIIATGNFFIRRDNMLLYADKAVINKTNKNIELSGNVKFFQIIKSRKEIEYWDLVDLQKNPYVKFKVVGTTMTPTGRQLLVVDEIVKSLAWSGKRTIGNLDSGVFEFGSFNTKLNNLYTKGKVAKRYNNGKLEIKNATLSTFPSPGDGDPIFSIKSSKLVATPSSGAVSTSLNSPGSSDNTKSTSYNNYSIWAYNNIFYVLGVPVMWLPVIYKPTPGKTGQWRLSTGSNTEYGYYLQTSNYWNLMDSDGIKVDTLNLIDYYQFRGLGLGNRTRISTDNSESQIFAYGINDDRANYNVPDNSRYKNLDDFRYYVDVKNKTHLTDRMDLRGRFGALSDYYFLNDYFDDVFRVDPQPSTYADLNQQFDWGTLSLSVHPKVNDFFTVVEELPKLELNVPRQEIWKNIYYQSQTNAAYMQMRWAKFKKSRAEIQAEYSPDKQFANYVEPDDYSAARFDSVHFIYYPMKIGGWLNVLPRAGFRFTAYSNSSKKAVNDDDVFGLIQASKPESFYSGAVVNYDDDGGAIARFIPEVGLQLNTKMYRSWSNVKNAFWNINGIRHVIQPYINYTLLSPTSNRDNIYYFDDIDRIDTQHFVRLGIENRLQTRRGGRNSSQVYTWASMQNYFDFLIDDKNRNRITDESSKNRVWNHLGDLGTILSVNPSENLQLTLNLLVDSGKLASGDVTNAFAESNLQANYNFADGWGIFGNWYYSRANTTAASYSMGSDLSQVESGTYFQREFGDGSYMQTGLNFKINDRTFGQTYLEYDFQNSMLPDFNISLNRELPGSLMLTLSYSVNNRKNTDGSGTFTNQGVNASLSFTNTPHYSIAPKTSLLPQYMSGAPQGAPVMGTPLKNS
ncbi:MAG: LPS-assembly protein LptD [bacterium]|nr:LPS-assembly protein LptD [bacterium]